MIDISITLYNKNYLYGGSVTANTEESYNNINWLDSRNKPSWDELNLEWNSIYNKIKKDNCETKAKQLIANCDWSVLSDVNLQNKLEFENYRSILRNLILNPIEDPIFPIEPTPIWSK
jgi:hypothetical protein